MRLFFALIAGRLISYLSKFLNLGGGSAAPGLYALKIDPELVAKLSAKIPKNVVITGTNGKTTTAKMLSHIAKEAGLKVVRNHTGSNLERGIASALIANYQLPTTNYQPDLGIWELDEAAFNLVAPKLNPNLVVFLNVFRDQLDRYGEIDTVVKKWAQTLQSMHKETLVLVNGDDKNTSLLRRSFSGKIKKFGVKDYKIRGEAIEHKKEKENLDYEAKNVRLNGLRGSNFLLQTTNYKLQTTLPLPGVYHIYDALAALGSADLLNLPLSNSAQAVKSYSPAFGRVEKLPFGYIFLIKNPAGATQVFETVAPNLNPGDRVLLALNDNLADGTDVSWIWDADFEKLSAVSCQLSAICSGSRAHDLALRLKYAGVTSLNIVADLKNALREARAGLKGRLFILPTYTAMLELQSILAKSGIKKHYWSEG